MSLGSRRLHCFGKMPKPAGETPTLPEANASTADPASLMLIDPDGNPVLTDQHVDSLAVGTFPD
jgi:hypothetical protein